MAALPYAEDPPRFFGRKIPRRAAAGAASPEDRSALRVPRKGISPAHAPFAVVFVTYRERLDRDAVARDPDGFATFLVRAGACARGYVLTAAPALSGSAFAVRVGSGRYRVEGARTADDAFVALYAQMVRGADAFLGEDVV